MHFFLLFCFLFAGVGDCKGWRWSLLDERDGNTDPASFHEFGGDEQNRLFV